MASMSPLSPAQAGMGARRVGPALLDVTLNAAAGLNAAMPLNGGADVQLGPATMEA